MYCVTVMKEDVILTKQSTDGLDIDQQSSTRGEFVLMGDIVHSSKYSRTELRIFKKVIDEVNLMFDFVSPLTITLGDEFQGLIQSLEQAFNVLFKIEDLLISRNYPFRIRYAIGQGEIITQINSDIAHGMYGPVLTQTRELLEKSKKDKRRRIDVSIADKEIEKVLNDLVYVYQTFIDNWNKKDYEMVSYFIRERDYLKVAKKIDKTKG